MLLEALCKIGFTFVLVDGFLKSLELLCTLKFTLLKIKTPLKINANQAVPIKRSIKNSINF